MTRRVSYRGQVGFLLSSARTPHGVKSDIGEEYTAYCEHHFEPVGHECVLPFIIHRGPVMEQIQM